ncbi:BRICK1 [Acrasis kona]|uniref:BRICK1 n=1 Tax=Acrasis kona TaxID=1008807 RepID=A0AAW2Z939_9EUKA
MSANNHMQEAIKNDWQNRDYVEGVSLSILKIAEFLNRFEQNTRVKMGELSEKLNILERKMEYVEGAIQSVEDQKAKQ